jgi:DNA-binding Lrp family transcriptional regulator
MNVSRFVERMDAKDVRIFCEMAFRRHGFDSNNERRLSPSEIAARVGLDEKTVRVRIKRMEDDGFIKYYQATPSLDLLGLSDLRSYRFGALNLTTKRNLVEYLESGQRIVEAFDYLGTVVSVSIAGSSGDEAQRAADDITSRFELDQTPLGSLPVRDSLAKLDRLDWRIIGALRYNARARASDVAKALSITPKMAEYRIKKLLDAGSMQVRAIIDPRKQQGLIFYELEISINEGAQSSVTKRLGEYGEKLWSVKKPREGVLLASLFAFSLGEPEDAAADFLGLDFVKSCSLYVLKEIVEARRPSWIDIQIGKETGATP